MEIQNILKKLASLKPGFTLSTTTMTVLNHNSWTSSFWRFYYGENRNEMLISIRKILNDAIELLSKTHSLDLKEDVIAALKGISVLKETYHGDYYTIAEIDRIITNVNANIKLYDDSQFSKSNESGTLSKPSNIELIKSQEKHNDVKEYNNSDSKNYTQSINITLPIQSLSNCDDYVTQTNVQIERNESDEKPRIFKRRPHSRNM